jgi:quercetin dioxygenase-like cupin family protein
VLPDDSPPNKRLQLTAARGAIRVRGRLGGVNQAPQRGCGAASAAEAPHRGAARVGEPRSIVSHFPSRILALPPFEGPFEASRLAAEGCEVLFASYPAGTSIDPHTHATENCGVITQGEFILIINGEEERYGAGEWYHLLPGAEHAARFEVETSEIEFWFAP